MSPHHQKSGQIACRTPFTMVAHNHFSVALTRLPGAALAFGQLADGCEH